MKIKALTQKQLTKFFIEDPTLVVLGLSDEQMTYLYSDHEYLMQTGSIYLGFYDNQSLIAVVAMDMFTNNTVSTHMYLKSDLQNNSLATDVAIEFRTYLLNKTKYTKAICPVPSTCVHVSNPLIHWGFKLEGCLTKAVIWRGVAVDLNIYAIDLVRSGA